MKRRNREIPETFAIRANGKVLLSGEYLVLHGASALAIPTSRGSTLKVSPDSGNEIKWLTRQNGLEVLQASLSTDGSLIGSGNSAMASRISSIFKAILKLRKEEKFRPSAFISDLEFSMNWGLGSSSTLIYSLASWAGLDAFELLELTFGGSGYDVACAGASNPILFRLEDGRAIYSEVPFNPPFEEMLHFVYLNKKVSSAQSVTEYIYLKNSNIVKEIRRIDEISEAMVKCGNCLDFSTLVQEHEAILSMVLKRPCIADEIFTGCPGVLKSLGAWGGDFILFIGHARDLDYFRQKGYPTIISYKDMICRKLH